MTLTGVKMSKERKEISKLLSQRDIVRLAIKELAIEECTEVRTIRRRYENDDFETVRRVVSKVKRIRGEQEILYRENQEIAQYA